MSSFLDSTGLSRLVSKITDYFAKKDGSYANLTAGQAQHIQPIVNAVYTNPYTIPCYALIAERNLGSDDNVRIGDMFRLHVYDSYIVLKLYGTPKNNNLYLGFVESNVSVYSWPDMIHFAVHKYDDRPYYYARLYVKLNYANNTPESREISLFQIASPTGNNNYSGTVWAPYTGYTTVYHTQITGTESHQSTDVAGFYGTALKVTVQDSAEGTQRDILCVDSDGKLRKCENISTYSDSSNGSLITLGTGDRMGVIRLYDNVGHYSSLRTALNVGATNSTFILGKPGVIPSKPNDGSDLGSVGAPIYMKSDGQLALCTDIGKEFWIEGTGSSAMYKTIGSIEFNDNGHFSQLCMEIGPLGTPWSADSQASKILVKLSCYGSNYKLNVLAINYSDITSRCSFDTYKANNRVYIVVKIVAYGAGAYVKVVSHGEMSWTAGVSYSAGTAPTTLDGGAYVTYKYTKINTTP